MYLDEAAIFISTSSVLYIFQKKDINGYQYGVICTSMPRIQGSGGRPIIHPMSKIMMTKILNITRIKITTHMSSRT